MDTVFFVYKDKLTLPTDKSKLRKSIKDTVSNSFMTCLSLTYFTWTHTAAAKNCLEVPSVDGLSLLMSPGIAARNGNAEDIHRCLSLSKSLGLARSYMGKGHLSF